jgi:hypothetical protein
MDPITMDSTALFGLVLGVGAALFLLGTAVGYFSAVVDEQRKMHRMNQRLDDLKYLPDPADRKE